MVFFLSVVKKKRSIFNLKSAESQKPKIKNLFLFFLFFVHRSSSHRFISLLILFLRFPFLFLFLFFFFLPKESFERPASGLSLQPSEKRREEQRREEKQRADRTHTIHISLFFDLLGHSPFPLLGSGILLLRVDGGRGGSHPPCAEMDLCSYAYSYAYTFVLLYIELYIYIYILITRILLPYHYYKLICIR